MNPDPAFSTPPTADYDRYLIALDRYAKICAEAPEVWHRADVTEFSELKRALLPWAEEGEVRCQYALATICLLGLCCESEEAFASEHVSRCEEATPWLIAAARQGYWPAVYNLATSGVGPEAARVSAAFAQLSRERADLVGFAHGMPVYGPPFVEALTRRLFGRVIASEAEHSQPDAAATESSLEG